MEEKKNSNPSIQSDDQLSLVVDENAGTVGSGDAAATSLHSDAAEAIAASGAPTEHEAYPQSAAATLGDAQQDNEGSGEQVQLGIPPRYKQLRFVGDGGMSIVYRAIDTGDGDKPVAIKLLKEELSRDASVVERFEREVAAMKTMAHPNIVQIFDSGMSSTGVPYFVSEYIDGGTLEEATRLEGHLSSDRSQTIFVQICKALQFAHSRGIVHRDIKPSNILLCRDEAGNEIAKLADFGIAKPPTSEPLFNTDLTRTGMILGSPAYMSPEQCRGHSVDERSDIYSLGCVMYETLTGTSPFTAENPIKAIIRHLEEPAQPFAVAHKKLGIPGGMEEVVMKCLAKEPKHRYQTTTQLLNVLSAPVLDNGGPRRVLAFQVDFWILLSVYMMLVFPLLSVSWILQMLCALCAYTFYFAGFESSPLGATPGKMLFNVRVRRKDGMRFDFLTACLYPLAVISFGVLVIFSPLLFLLSLPISYGWGSPFSQAEYIFLVPTFALSTVFAWLIDRRTRCEGRPLTTGAVAPVRKVKEKVLAMLLIALLPMLAVAAAPQLALMIADSGDVPVLAATKPILAGHRIEENDVRLFHLPRYLPVVPSPVRSVGEAVGKIAELSIARYNPIVQEAMLPSAMEKARYTRHAEIMSIYPTVTAIYDPATGKQLTPENAAQLLGNQSENFKRYRASDEFDTSIRPLNLPSKM